LIDEEGRDRIIAAIKNKDKEVPPEFEELASKLKANQDNPNYNSGLHVLAVLASDVAEVVNDRGTFGDMVRGILNNSSMVQLHLKMKVKGEDMAIKEFGVKYPPQFEGTILLDSKKNYFSSGIKGRYSFKIK